MEGTGRERSELERGLFKHCVILFGKVRDAIVFDVVKVIR